MYESKRLRRLIDTAPYSPVRKIRVFVELKMKRNFISNKKMSSALF